MSFWRYAVPRRRYFRSLKVARVCPEIEHIVEAQARISAKSYAFDLFWVPTVGVVALICGGLTLLFAGVLSILPRRPDFDGEKIDLNYEAWRVVPLEEIRERMGDEVPRILSKKSDA